VKLIGGFLLLAALTGLLFGGRPANLARIRLRWMPLAIVGFALQLVNLPGRLPGTDLEWPLVFLLTSFVLLVTFGVANLSTTGFSVILLGTLLNFTVIAANGGMPVSREALVKSGQANTVKGLSDSADLYVKHHLAGPDDHVRMLGDVIALPPPISQAISVGDIFTYGGVVIVIVTAMRRRPDEELVAIAIGREVEGARG
jgi:Family of unknown function (DUF5317)